jgi:hypothetical protein
MPRPHIPPGHSTDAICHAFIIENDTPQSIVVNTSISEANALDLSSAN